ncbi:MAG: hypothetical protein DRQ99_27910, partial [Candidatus Parabeggiatoa sp. nov. 3]
MEHSNQLKKRKYDMGANRHVMRYILKSGIKNPKILDVGCGIGNFGLQLSQKIECQIDGIDFCKEALEEAKSKNAYRNLYCLDLNNLTNGGIPIDESYDFIVCSGIFEYIIDYDALLNSFKAKLKENGIMNVALTNIGFIYLRLVHLLGGWENRVIEHWIIRFFTLNSARDFFRRNGLEILRIDPMNEVRDRYFFLRFLGKMWPSLFAIQIVFHVKV